MKQATLSRTVAIAALAAAAALSLAQAQTLSVGRKVNRDELRECLSAGDTIKARSDELKARSARLNAVNDELKAESDEIKQQLERQESGSSLMGVGRDRLERRKAAFDRKVVAARTDSEKFGPMPRP